MRPVDVPSLLAEDAAEESKGVPFRFGYPFEVSYDLVNAGTWETLPDGGRLWRLAISSPGAYSINLVYRDFRLPPGARFFIYNEDRSMVIGAFTRDNNKEHGRFATGLVKGDKCILEYYEPPDVVEPGIIDIERIVHAYKNLFDRAELNEAMGFGGSGSCNNNVNCPEGAEWQDDKRSVAMITTQGGFRLCTGALVNNIREDLTPYFLTANHCLGGEDTWVFMFNYESPSCANIDGPTWMTVSGSTLRSTSTNSDFALLELSEQPPDSYAVYYAGWSADGTAAQSAVGIHHPSGDIKKISFDYDPVTTSGSFWQIGVWDDGTTEPGSSGSPLFDSMTHRIIGQLCCGTASCQSLTSDFYGKFSISWNGAGPSTRLRDWLDPDNTGVLVLDGLDPLGVNFSAIPKSGQVPLDVLFTGTSTLPVDTWTWDFGDGDSAFVQAPNHIYDEPGVYDVKLEIESESETLFRDKPHYIVALADTLSGNDTAVFPGQRLSVTLNLVNIPPINRMILPIEYGGTLDLTLDSVSREGCRTDYFEIEQVLNSDINNKRKTYQLIASTDGSQPELPAGSGPVFKLFFAVSGSAAPGQSAVIDLSGYSIYELSLSGSYLTYAPELVTPALTYADCCEGIRGNVDNDPADEVNVVDITYLVDYMFRGGPFPECGDEADVDGLGAINVADLTLLVDYIFKGGAAPPPCP